MGQVDITRAQNVRMAFPLKTLYSQSTIQIN